MRFLFCLLSLVGVARTNPFPLPVGMIPEGTDHAVVETGKSRFANYMHLPLPFPPAEQLRQAIEERLKTRLLHRGEAHVTIVLPTEYNPTLKKFLTTDDLATIAAAHPIDGKLISLQCVGRAQAGNDWTYFAVVNAPGLVKIREAVAKIFLERGGDPNAFRAAEFTPHITLGYTKRDLHEADNVTKGPESCWEDFKR